jgi:hypothetical protein
MLDLPYHPRPPDDAALTVKAVTLGRQKAYQYTLEWAQDGKRKGLVFLSEQRHWLDVPWKGEHPSDVIVERIFADGRRVWTEKYTLFNYQAQLVF